MPSAANIVVVATANACHRLTLVRKQKMKITIETTVHAPIEKVWEAWVTPDDIMRWNFASEDWSCPKATIDLQEGNKFNYRMEAKDGSMGFDFEGTFTEIKEYSKIEYSLEDNRGVVVAFSKFESGVRVTETFEAEDEYTAEQQRQGWLCILNNFKRYVEKKLD